MRWTERGAPLLLAVVLGSLPACWGLRACDKPRPIEETYWKLWRCDARQRHCTLYARFEGDTDCEEFGYWLNARCDPNVPKGYLRCSRRDDDPNVYTTCTRRDLTFADVHGDGGWLQPRDL